MIKERKMQSEAICIQDYFDNYLEIFCNSFKAGHKTLYWFRSENPENVFSITIPSEHFIISGFNISDKYTFYTSSGKDDTSETVECYLKYIPLDKFIPYLFEHSSMNHNEAEDSLQELNSSINESMFNIISMFANTDDHHYDINFDTGEVYDAISVQYDSAIPNIPALIIKSYKSIEEPQEEDISSYSDLYDISSKFNAMKAIHLNSSNINLKIDSLISPIMIDGNDDSYDQIILSEIDDYNMYKPIKKIYYTYNDSSLLSPSIDMRYSMKFIRENNILCDIRGYQPPAEITSYLVGQKRLNKNSFMQRDNEINSATDTDLTEEEMNVYSIEKTIEPRNWIFENPVFMSYNGDKFEFYINDYDVMESANKDFYIAAREDDVISDPGYERAVPINSEIVIYNCAESYSGGNMAFYIIDENHNIVSGVTHASTDIDNTEYRDKVRIMELDNCINKMSSFFKSRAPEYLPYLAEYISEVYYDDDVYSKNLWKKIMTQAITDQRDYDVFKFLCMLFESLHNGFMINKNFYNGSIYYNPSTDIISIPFIEGKKAAAVIISFDEYGDTIVEAKEIVNTSIDVKLSRYERCIIFSVDLTDYTRSGYIAAERINNSFRLFSDNVTLNRL